ncbi:phospholipase A2 inhibitor and Ly6/PLAUR domain-containing protein-like [Pelobates fuscus]|uniref:phospholipase A2 inhibitor and Ly6/PLAUR domain-containing protein-like n=1 Tax=Pelobates fuscus TaxID=191477 RepID=UPI002FE453A6
MDSLLGFLCVLSTLVAAGHSLSCTQCLVLNGTSCTGDSITCPSGNYFCSSSITANNVVSGYTASFTRTCSPAAQCNQTGSITFLYGTILVGTSCCGTDNCTPATPTLPTSNSTSNGLTCQNCFSYSPDCYTGTTLACTGAENKCLRLSETISGNLALTQGLRGCATSSMCDVLGTQTLSASGYNVNINVVCTNGKDGLHHGFLFSTLVSIVMAKLFS